ncbi:MAG: PQQ-binding-like beta-propeller repeat protein [Planctomycetes bacterium]|nr:PQQ-binding-like beta-propeller repeat protein [Planctomycetota bacterium]
MRVSSRLSSVCPVRTAILVDDGIAYWGAGLLSGAQTGLRRYVIAADAETGIVLWSQAAPKPLQGYPLASAENLYMPAGKNTPVSFRKSDGLYLGAFGAANSRQGGAYAVLSYDNKLYFGPHYSGEGSYIGKYDAGSRAEEAVAWGPGNHLVVTPSHAYYSSDTTISKIYRSTKQVAWSLPCDYPYELILAKDLLFAGGENEVGALGISNGSILWTAPVKGRIRSLAVADSRLFVSTNRGTIHCFRAATATDTNNSAEDPPAFATAVGSGAAAKGGRCGDYNALKATRQCVPVPGAGKGANWNADHPHFVSAQK